MAESRQDDIYLAFGGGSGQSGLVKEVISGWTSFIKNLDPDTPQTRGASGPWRPFSPASTSRDIKALGGGQVRECPAGFWGLAVKNDWQLYA